MVISENLVIINSTISYLLFESSFFLGDLRAGRLRYSNSELTLTVEQTLELAGCRDLGDTRVTFNGIVTDNFTINRWRRNSYS